MAPVKRLAYWLRRAADRIDHEGSPKLLRWSFTFEEYRGIVFREDGRGCRLAYLGDKEYERSHDEADCNQPVLCAFGNCLLNPERCHLPGGCRRVSACP